MMIELHSLYLTLKAWKKHPKLPRSSIRVVSSVGHETDPDSNKPFSDEEIIGMKDELKKNAPTSYKELFGEEDQIIELDKKFPFVPHTNAGRLFSTVRRMKAEKEASIPINDRSGFAISVKTGHHTNEMEEQEWNDFYENLCDDLKSNYPELYYELFPENK